MLRLSVDPELKLTTLKIKPHQFAKELSEESATLRPKDKTGTADKEESFIAPRSCHGRS